MFLNIQIDTNILKTGDEQFTLTTKKSLRIIFKDRSQHRCKKRFLRFFILVTFFTFLAFLIFRMFFK